MADTKVASQVSEPGTEIVGNLKLAVPAASDRSSAIRFSNNEIDHHDRADSRFRESVRHSRSSNVSITEEEVDRDLIAYPPLSSSARTMRLASKINKIGCFIKYADLATIEHYCAFIGGVLFVWGSYLFLPTLPKSTKVPAATMFIVGSVLFEIAALCVYRRFGAHLWLDYGLSFNSSLYLVANFGFIIGSVLFWPGLPKPYELAGIWLFIVGSGIFLFAPLYDIYRAHQSFQEETERITIARNTLQERSRANTLCTINSGTVYNASPAATASGPAAAAAAGNNPLNPGPDAFALAMEAAADIEEEAELEKEMEVNFVTFVSTALISGMYITGSLLFVVGSVMFLPQFYSRDSVIAVNIFIAGSVLFFVATIVPDIVKYSVRIVGACGMSCIDCLVSEALTASCSDSGRESNVSASTTQTTDSVADVVRAALGSEKTGSTRSDVSGRSESTSEAIEPSDVAVEC